MIVQLIFAPSHDEALNILYSACRQCYHKGFVGDRYPFDDISREDKSKLIKRIIGSGHHSVLEHVSFTFAIGGISRAAAQQLTRHRMASYSMMSMRYCDTGVAGIEIPYTVKDENYDIYQEAANSAVETYNELVKNGVPREDARGILPLNWKSNLVMTMNCRELLHFFSERLCRQAQHEIRNLAGEMLKICSERLPDVFECAGPKCKVNGFCNEGDRSCHLYPLKEDILDFYKKNKKSSED